jgi:hypothetical protein
MNEFCQNDFLSFSLPIHKVVHFFISLAFIGAICIHHPVPCITSGSYKLPFSGG